VSEAKVTDAGWALIVSGGSEEAARIALLQHEARGYRRLGEPVRVGARWIASLGKPGETLTMADGSEERPKCMIERQGLTLFVRGPSKEAVQDAVSNLRTGGVALVAPIEQLAGEWTAICSSPAGA
jgi:hypothetical protein